MKEKEQTTDNRILRFRLVTFVGIMAFSISTTFTLTTIYQKFLSMENEITSMKDSIVERDDMTNGRIDKISKRMLERIKELEKSGSDAQ